MRVFPHKPRAIILSSRRKINGFCPSFTIIVGVGIPGSVGAATSRPPASGPECFILTTHFRYVSGALLFMQLFCTIFVFIKQISTGDANPAQPQGRKKDFGLCGQGAQVLISGGSFNLV